MYKRQVQDALNEWMSSRISDNLIAEVCRRRVLSSITSGFLSRNVWFDEDDRSGFLQSLDGTALERDALSTVLDNIEGGVHIKENGTLEILDDLVIRVDEAACHPVLMTLWND